MASNGSVDRPDINDLRTMSYNRVNVPSDLKNTICSQILDSTESLPLWEKGEYDNSYDEVPSSEKNNNSGNYETRRLAKDTSDVATPKLEKGNPMDEVIPLDQQKTAPAEDIDDVGASKGDRPGTLRRLTTRIKKTISSNHSGAENANKLHNSNSPAPAR